MALKLTDMKFSLDLREVLVVGFNRSQRVTPEIAQWPKGLYDMTYQGFAALVGFCFASMSVCLKPLVGFAFVPPEGSNPEHIANVIKRVMDKLNGDSSGLAGASPA